MGKVYDLEFKEYISRMVVEENRKMTELARELDISYSSINSWVKDYKQKTGWVDKKVKKDKDQEKKVYKTSSDYEKEYEILLKENERLDRENRILKKAMHVFTENHE